MRQHCKLRSHHTGGANPKNVITSTDNTSCSTVQKLLTSGKFLYNGLTSMSLIVIVMFCKSGILYFGEHSSTRWFTYDKRAFTCAPKDYFNSRWTIFLICKVVTKFYVQVSQGSKLIVKIVHLKVAKSSWLGRIGHHHRLVLF
jgi:hypothetical protein